MARIPEGTGTEKRGKGPGADPFEAVLRSQQVRDLLAQGYSIEAVADQIAKQFSIRKKGIAAVIGKVDAERQTAIKRRLMRPLIELKAEHYEKADVVFRASMRDKKFSAANQAIRTQMLIAGTAAPIVVEVTDSELVERRARQIAKLLATNTPEQIRELIAEGEAVED